MFIPPQNLNLIDYAMAEAERVFIGARFLLRERACRKAGTERLRNLLP
jgi:hypothetical protein